MKSYRMALTEDGRITMCTSSEENIGKGRCNHVDHQMDDESSKEFIERLQKDDKSREKILNNISEVFKKANDPILNEDGKRVIFNHKNIPKNDDGSYYSAYSYENAMSLSKLDLGFYLNALNKLDESLKGKHELKIAGGFSMLMQGQKRLTPDIDIQGKIDDDLSQAIDAVCKESGLDSDWLNNDNVLEEDNLDFLDEETRNDWVDVDMGFKNLKIKIQSTDSMIKRKIAAISMTEIDSFRLSKDYLDFVRLCKSHNIKLKAALNKYAEDEFEMASALRCIVKEQKRRKAAKELKDKNK